MLKRADQPQVMKMTLDDYRLLLKRGLELRLTGWGACGSGRSSKTTKLSGASDMYDCGQSQVAPFT